MRLALLIHRKSNRAILQLLSPVFVNCFGAQLLIPKIYFHICKFYAILIENALYFCPIK